MKKSKPARTRRWLWLVALLALVLGVGSFAGDRLLKSRDHPGLGVFLRQWWVNYPASFAVEPLHLSIKVNDKDLEHLLQVVEDARARGVILPEGNDYVTAQIGNSSDTFKAKVRIKGKLTDHVQGSKWSFRVIAKKDGGFLGMRRFSLQHPGTRNYLYDWFYHKLMASEGIVALRYGFVHLEFNGEDLGVYAYEEHFGPELLEHNGRVEGPLFRFDPGLFWQHRLNEMNKLRYDEPFAAYQAANVDAFGSSAIEKDPKTRVQFEEAVALLDAFRRGELKASQVFDADRIARRHAVLDLIGGHHSMDWSDVKFYYDPVVRRVEPISYESFSAFKLRSLAGSNKWIGRSEPGQDLHDQFFNDETVFRAYVHHLERMSRRSWLDSTFTSLKPALDSASAMVYREFPYKELDRSIYYGNQAVIRRLLDVPKPFHAYFDGASSDTVRVTVVPIEGLPMEVHVLDLGDGMLIVPTGSSIVPCRKPGKLGEPMMLRFSLPKGAKAPKPSGVKIICSVLGASSRKTVEVFPYALLDGTEVAGIQRRSAEARTIPFLHFNDEEHTIIIASGAWTIDGDIELPAGYVVTGVAPLKLDLTKGAQLLSRSPIHFKGQEEAPVHIGSSDRSGAGITVLEARQRSRWEHVRITGFGPSDRGRAALLFQESPLDWKHVAVEEDVLRDVLQLVRSNSSLTNVSIVGGRDQVLLNYCEATLKSVNMSGAGDDGLTVRGGDFRADGLAITKAKGTGLKVAVQAKVSIKGLHINAKGKGIEVGDGAALSVDGATIEAAGIALEVRNAEMISGPSQVELMATKLSGGKGNARTGKGNRVDMDGEPMKDDSPTAPKKKTKSDT